MITFDRRIRMSGADIRIFIILRMCGNEISFGKRFGSFQTNSGSQMFLEIHIVFLSPFSTVFSTVYASDLMLKQIIFRIG